MGENQFLTIVPTPIESEYYELYDEIPSNSPNHPFDPFNHPPINT